MSNNPIGLMGASIKPKHTLYGGILTAFIAGCLAIVDGLKTGEMNHMIFGQEMPAFWIGTILAFFFVITVKYFFRWQVYKREHPDKLDSAKFEMKYVISAICTIVVSAIVTYIVCQFGIGYLFPNAAPIATFGFALILAFVIAGLICYAVDACVFHPIVDGTAAMLDVKAEKAVREKILSEENLAKAREALIAQAKSFGIQDAAKIDYYVANVKETDSLLDRQKIAAAVNSLTVEQLGLFKATAEKE